MKTVLTRSIHYSNALKIANDMEPQGSPSSGYTTFNVVGSLCSLHYTTCCLVIGSLAVLASSFYVTDLSPG